MINYTTQLRSSRKDLVNHWWSEILCSKICPLVGINSHLLWSISEPITEITEIKPNLTDATTQLDQCLPNLQDSKLTTSNRRSKIQLIISTLMRSRLTIRIKKEILAIKKRSSRPLSSHLKSKSHRLPAHKTKCCTWALLLLPQRLNWSRISC